MRSRAISWRCVARARSFALSAVCRCKLTVAAKPLYHAAAAFAAGHVLAIEEAAVQLLMLAGMKRGEAVRALLQLTRQVLDNFERLGPRAAWTGPLARGDFGVVATHMSAMRRLPREFSQAYTALNDLAKLVLVIGALRYARDME